LAPGPGEPSWEGKLTIGVLEIGSPVPFSELRQGRESVSKQSRKQYFLLSLNSLFDALSTIN